MNDHLYFAYGSNLDPSQMRRRCPGSVLDCRATLAGYALAFGGYSATWDGPVATLVRAAKSKVEGLLYRITEEDLATLDRFEGHPLAYVRQELELRDEHGAARRALVYVKPEGSYELGDPPDDYYEVIRSAYAERGFDLGALDRAAGR